MNMKKTISILILLILIPTLCFAGSLQEKQKAVIAKKNVPVGGGTENIGNESVGASQGGVNSSYIYCGKVAETPTHNGSVDSVTISFAKVSSNGEVHIALYTHNSGSDVPENLVANSGSGAIAITNASPLTDYTHTYTGTKPTVSSGTQYWICFQRAAANEVTFGYDDGAGRRSLCTLDTYGSWPATLSNQGTAAEKYGKLYFVNSY
jgi:hypothetical protein